MKRLLRGWTAAATGTAALGALVLAACEQGTAPIEPKASPVPAQIRTVLVAVQARQLQARALDYNPPADDADDDGLTDSEELELGTDPYWPDSDHDQRPDGFEVANGEDPLTPASLDPRRQQAQQCAVDAEQAGDEPRGAGLLIANGLSCTEGPLNVRTCTATCTGTCCFGTVSCYWSWDPVSWGMDKLVGNPCPGWHCNCP